MVEPAMANQRYEKDNMVKMWKKEELFAPSSFAPIAGKVIMKVSYAA